LPKHLVCRHWGFLLLLLLVGAHTVKAQDSILESRRFSLTVSPLLLAYSIVELTGEYRLASPWSVAAIAGAGKGYTAAGGSGIGLGLQGRHYPFRPSRHERHVGLEAMLWAVRIGQQPNGMADSETEQLYTLTPFLGYKYTASFGLTLEAQFGAGVGLIRERIEFPEFTSVNMTYVPALLVNLNAGWSF
jgi:hypothetical protein